MALGWAFNDKILPGAWRQHGDHSRKLDVIDKTAEELTTKTGGKIIAVPADVRKYEEIENVIRTAEKEFGAVHGVVNNAAGNFISPTERLSHRAFDIVVDIVLKGTYYTTLAAGKNWISKKQPGCIFKHRYNLRVDGLWVCCTIGLQQSRSARSHKITCS